MKKCCWNYRKILVLLILVLMVPIYCFIHKQGKDDTTVSVVNDWIGREIKMPNNFQCNLLKADTVMQMDADLLNSEYKVLLYVDSIGCMTCKLNFQEWSKLISEFEKISLNKLSFLFFLHQKNEKEVRLLLKRENFNYPVFMDTKNEINQLNNFSTRSEFQCFLLDKNNKVLLVGNPVKNMTIKDLYLKTILNEERKISRDRRQIILTAVTADKSSIYWGDFDWKQEQKAEFVLTNTGTNPLVIDNTTVH